MFEISSRYAGCDLKKCLKVCDWTPRARDGKGSVSKMTSVSLRGQGLGLCWNRKGTVPFLKKLDQERSK